MGVTLLENNTVEGFRERIAALTPESERKWGTMTAPKMLRHLSFTFEMSMGKVEIRPLKNPAINNPLTQNLIKVLAFYVFTNWPKGVMKAPSNFQPPEAGEFEDELKLVLGGLDEFISELEKDPGAKHRNPMLGLQPLTFWSRLHGIHLNHHLSQFGV